MEYFSTSSEYLEAPELQCEHYFVEPLCLFPKIEAQRSLSSFLGSKASLASKRPSQIPLQLSHWFPSLTLFRLLDFGINTVRASLVQASDDIDLGLHELGSQR